MAVVSEPVAVVTCCVLFMDALTNNPPTARNNDTDGDNNMEAVFCLSFFYLFIYPFAPACPLQHRFIVLQ